MSSPENVRIDKYLWAIRLFKTRSLAAEACKKGRVAIQGQPAKSSRIVKIGDIIDIRIPPITRKFRVVNLSEKRMGAKFTPDFIEEITPNDQIELLEMTRLANSMGRRKGMGRPTKKDRRDLNKLSEEI